MAKLTAKLPFKLGGPSQEGNVFRLRLLSTRSPEAYVEDVEYNLRGVAQILGGTAYQGGVAVSYPGAVSVGDHLRPGTKIGLDRRVEKYGYTVVQAVFGTPASVTDNDIHAYIPAISCLGEHIPVACHLSLPAMEFGSTTVTGTFSMSTKAGSYLAVADTPVSIVPLSAGGQGVDIPVSTIAPAPGSGADDYIDCHFVRTDNYDSVPVGLQVTLVVKALHTA